MTGPKRMTDKQLAANRANALRSTGPRTPEGKAVSRYNALRHGVLSQAVIPEPLEPYESRDEFDHLLATLIEEYAPATAIEQMMVERIATAYWRLARAYRAEAGQIASRQAGREADMARSRRANELLLALGGDVAVGPGPEIDRLTKALQSSGGALRSLLAAEAPRWRDAPEEELRAAAEQRLAALQAERDRQEAHKVAVAVARRAIPGLDEALKFARYETAIQRQLDTALSTLERLQRRRAGEFVAPPLQIEVNAAIEGSDAPDGEP